MKDNRLKGIIALAVVTLVSFGIIYGSKILVKDETNSGNNSGNADNTQDQQDLPGAIDVAGAEGIVAAREITDDSGNVTAYSVTSQARGFAPKPVTMEIIFENDAKTIREVKVVSHSETPGYGATVEEESFLNQFKGISAPIYLKGQAPANSNTDNANTNNEQTTTPDISDGFKDGVYYVHGDYDNSGYMHELTVVVEGGKITSVVYDAKNKQGEYKSYLSSVGEYVMTEDGLTWKEQADALAAYVMEHQSTEGLNTDDNGKTDVVAGVSISIDTFLKLAEDALKMAVSGEGAESTGSGNAADTTASADGGAVGEIDGISGATMTTNAVLELVNKAYEFIKNYAGK